MNYESVFSALSLIAVYIYLHVGLSAYRHNAKSKMNRIFLLLCISYAIWSFAYAFAYLSTNSRVFSFWNKISALGWCSFSAITLYLVLLITDNTIAKKRITKVLVFLPAILFLYMAVFLFGEGINTPILISNIFYIGDFLYNFSFLLLSIILIFIWGVKSESKRVKIQSRILLFSSIIPFCLNLITQTLFPLFGVKNFPNMGQLYSLIMILGTYIVIEKYKFLKIPVKIILEEVENRILDMIIILNEKAELIKISNHTLNLLGYKESELLNKNIGVLFDDTDKENFLLSNTVKQEVIYNDIKVLKKNNDKLPVNLQYIPIWDKNINDFLGAAIVMQDISIVYELQRKNEELHQKNIRDGLTNLYNHQYSFEVLDKEINKLNEENRSNTLSLMMIDIDYFKRVNDTYGHLFGDYILKTLADILTKIIKDKGYVGRFGGEEFIIILPNIALNTAYEIGEKIRKEIEYYIYDKNCKLTVSIGLNQYINQYSIDFVKETDDLLYKAKQNGRNRVESLIV